MSIVLSLTPKPIGKEKVAHHSTKLLKYVVFISKMNLLEVSFHLQGFYYNSLGLAKETLEINYFKI